MDVSIVIPFYNEEDSVAPLCSAVKDALIPTDYDFEVILVDDGSTDRTFEIAQLFARGDSRFRVIKLRANFGQTPALYAGFDHARGNVIVSMDGDLQNDPLDIPEMVEKIRDGFDVVTGWRENRQDAFLVRKIPSIVANAIVRLTTGVQIRDNGCGLRAYRAAVVKKLSLYSEMHRLLPTILALTGARMTEVKVRHHARQFGSSKYGLSRIYKFILDFTTLRILLTTFRRPLFGFGLIPMFCFMGSGLLFLASVYLVFTHPGMSLTVLLGSAVLIGSLGFSLLILGILCDVIYDSGMIRVEDLIKSEMY